MAVVHVTLWWMDHNPWPRALWGDEKANLSSAVRLLAGDPSWWPEPLWPPLYPQYIAGLLWIGGGSLAAVVLAQSLLLSATAVLLFDLTRRVTGSRAAGVAVAAATLGYPPLAAFSHYLWPEILHLFLFVALLWILASRIRNAVWCAVAGVLLGLALLSKSLLMPFVPVLLVVAVWGLQPKDALQKAGLLLGFTALTVAPTLFANARRTGSPFLANSAAFNILVGLNDVGRESFRHDVVWPEYQKWEASADTYGERDRILWSRIRDFVAERGWISTLKNQISKQYFRLFDVGCYLTDQLPGGAARLQSGAGYLGVGPGLSRAVKSAAVAGYLFLLVVVPVGLIAGGCRSERWVRTLVVFLAYNLAVFLWLHVKTRYRIQMMPAALIGLGCFVAWMEAGCRQRPTMARAAATGGVVALLMWFALG